MEPITINLDLHGQACVWLQDSPEILYYPALDIINKDLKTGLVQKLKARKQAVLEIMIPVGPRVCYGLLGAQFIPNDSDKLSLEVRVSTEEESIFESSIAAQVDTVRIGLPEEYSQSVIDGIVASRDYEMIKTLGSGVILVDKAAHGEINSSKKFFRNIAATVIQLLLLKKASTKSEVTDIVKNYSLL